MDHQTKDMLDRSESCQEAVIAALVGYPLPAIMAALTAVTGAMLGMHSRSKAEMAPLLDQVVQAVKHHAENGFELSMGGDRVQ